MEENEIMENKTAEANEVTENVMEEQPAETPPKKKKLGKILYFGLLAVFIAVFVYCAYYISNYMIESKESEDQFDRLSDIVNSMRENNASDDISDATLPSGGESSDDPVQTSAILPEYQAIYEMNNDLVGWIRIEGTNIDYPVMQTPDAANYYLKRNFGKAYSARGCIYAREQCDVFTPSDNVVLYGHHMKDGTMFAELDEYQIRSYWEEHQYIEFDTLYEHHTYQVIAVFKTTATVGEGFPYHAFNNAANQEEFDAFMAQVHELEIFSTGMTAEYGDMLLTLSTCEYTMENGRFVVIAKRIS